MNKIRNTESQEIREKRKGLVRETKDEAHNIKRATDSTGSICIVCGRRIKKGQRIRIMPKDKNCQETRIYHLRTCGPGSHNWEAFKSNGKKTLKRSFQWQQLSFNWNKMKGG